MNASYRRALRWLGLLLLLSACNQSLGPEPAGQSITGTLFYEGDMGAGFTDPAFLIVATTSPDPDVIPHALKVVRAPSPSEPTAYELQFLPAGRYFLIAQLVDLANFDPLSAPVGAFPDSCVLVDMPMGRSLMLNDADRDEVDIVVRDSLFSDGCFGERVDLTLDECPAPTKMAVALTVQSSTPAPTEGADRLVLGLFENFPPAPEAGTRLVVRPGDFEFPQLAGLNEQTPGTYYVYACLDVNGDNTEGECGDEDRFAVSETPIDFPVGMIHRVTADLDTGVVTLEGSDVPDAVACMPNATLRVNVSAPGLTPAADDILAVTIFKDFPGLRDPDFLGQVTPTEFPTTIDVPVDADDYFVIVCFQRADSPSENCAGPEDRLTLYMNLTEEVTVAMGETVTIDVELEE